MNTPEERFWAKVEKTADCWNWTGSTNGRYGLLSVNSKHTRAHRFSYEIANGCVPAGLVIDHKCHNTLCVKPAHLRAITQKQNCENLAGAHKRSRSGVRGVHWRKDAKRWQVTVSHHGKSSHHGYFRELADAEAAAIAGRNELFTHNDADKSA